MEYLTNYSSSTYNADKFFPQQWLAEVDVFSLQSSFILLLSSVRFNCLKCGCTGEAEEASYRYRLSLKIADTNDLFDITVFGSCLDPFFGVTAGNLQR